MLVTVVMPSFNVVSFIDEAITSVLDQTMTDWELIIIDNFSEDGTIEVIKKFNDSRISLHRRKNHGVIASSRNYGISLARGKYVAFLDADDYWNPDKLLQSVAALETGYDLVCHAEYWTWTNGKSKKVNYGPDSELIYERLLLDGNRLSTSAVVVRTNVLRSVEGFSENPTLVTVEDYDLWLRLSMLNYKFVTVDEVLGHYRLHGSNSVAKPGVYLAAMLSVLESHFSLRDNASLSNRLKLRRISNVYAEVSGIEISAARFKSGLHHLLCAVKKYPVPRKELLLPGLGLARYVENIARKT